MIIKKIKELNSIQKKEILKIWNDEYPSNLAYNNLVDFEIYLDKLINSEHFVAYINSGIVGWIVEFERDGGNWFVIMVSSQKQRKGIATKLIETVKRNSTELNGWVIDTENYTKQNGQVYKSPIEFYKKVGFEITKDRLENEKLSAVQIKWVEKPAGNNVYN